MAAALTGVPSREVNFKVIDSLLPGKRLSRQDSTLTFRASGFSQTMDTVLVVKFRPSGTANTTEYVAPGSPSGVAILWKPGLSSRRPALRSVDVDDEKIYTDVLRGTPTSIVVVPCAGALTTLSGISNGISEGTLLCFIE